MYCQLQDTIKLKLDRFPYGKLGVAYLGFVCHIHITVKKKKDRHITGVITRTNRTNIRIWVSS